MPKINVDDRRRVAQALRPLAQLYPNWKAEPGVWDTYAKILADINPETLQQAIDHLCAEPREFMPVPGIIRQVAFEFQARAEGVPESYEAWEEVQKAISAVGSWGKPEFSHPLIEKTVNTIGWMNLCMSENSVADRARFIQAFEQYRDRNEKDRRMLPQVSQHIAKLADKLSADRKALPDKAEKEEQS